VGRSDRTAQEPRESTEGSFVEQNTHAKGPYREVLDWLAAQIEQLDAHEHELEAKAAQHAIDPAELEARRASIANAHAWLADQLEQALVARGMALAA
jgi:hypothetical protein